MSVVCLLSIFNSRPFFCFSPAPEAGQLVASWVLCHTGQLPLYEFAFPGKETSVPGEVFTCAGPPAPEPQFSPSFHVLEHVHALAQVWAPKMQSSELPLRSGQDPTPS